MQNNQKQIKKLSENSATEQQKTLEKLSVIAFIVSVFLFIASFFLGMNYSIFIFFMEVYFAVQGLRSTPRGKRFAYATFVFAGLTIISIIIQMGIERGLISF